MKNRITSIFCCIVFGLGMQSCINIKSSESDAPASLKTIILVRHAEKAQDHPNNPTLLPEGEARAKRLAIHLKDWGIEQIFSTDFIRTQNTVEPLANLLNLEIESYKVDSLWDFAQDLKTSEAKNILICGHTDINPKMINYLIGEEVYEEMPLEEYDGIYVVLLFENTKPEVKIFRY